jgi:hypothetical protein
VTDATTTPSRPRWAGRWALAGVVAVGGLVAAGAVAWAEAPAGPETGAATVPRPGPGDPPGARHHARDHTDRAPYDERYAAATPGEQEAADTLLADVEAALAAYADPEAAEAAGYAPRRPDRARGGVVHYLNRDLARDGTVLDPARPDGLVYHTGGERPVLLGAFFVAPRGTTAPSPAPDLVTWHTHDPACPAFFVTDAEPCTGSRRMLHVWTAGDVALTSPRTGRTVEVRVADPFGAPFTASIARAS